jgi:hypothetical protein
MRQLGKRVSGTGRDDQKVGGVTKPNMKYVRFAAPQVGVGVGAAAGDRLKGHRCNEFFSGRGEHHIHERAGLRQLGGQICGLICGNGTGHAQQDMFVI